MDYITPTAEMRQRYLGFLKCACREVDSPLAKKILRELNRNVFRLDGLDAHPSDYSDPFSFQKDRMLLGLITKWPGLHLGVDPEDECRKTFWRFEKQCLETNLRLESGQLAEPDVEAILYIAREKIRKLLGECPKPADLSFTFGPGATRNVRTRTSPFHKLKAEPECTIQALPAALRLIKSVPWLWTHWGGTDTCCPRVKIVHGSRSGQVPKSAKTNRPIDIEPTLNGVLQRGYGRVIRNRLSRAGICLKTGQQRHSMLAWEGSVTKRLATIDKSGASDSIATHLVLRLLPPDWFEALDNCRSHRHVIDGKTYDLEKFSAMGNGYTFELESVIFLCLARATAEHLQVDGKQISIYGDDLICPEEIVHVYTKVCDFAGFTINQEKSFWGDSPFRESCGADWFNGVDVTVAYMRHNASPHYLTTLHNRLFELGLNHVIPKAFSCLRDIVPERYRIFGPPSDHKYGYLFSDARETCKAISIRPRKRIPVGGTAYAYGMYTLQFMDDPSERNPSDPFNQCPQGHVDFTNWKGSLDLSRFTNRNDFKLSSRTIRFDGTLPPRKIRLTRQERRRLEGA